MQPWLEAFLLTQCIEVPLYCALLRSVPIPKRIALGFSATAVTHPVVWFVIHSISKDFGLPHAGYMFVAECYAVGVEGLLLWAFGQRKPWAVALLVNMVSFGAGLTLQCAGLL